ncbi:unnamed protein product [Hymenolepis diminuta]|uniref:Protein kinase domain-containing protein n=1 Tax=Hymenolepis diminuta TaxID=6216 RepID=A0A158QFC7_HYMDI|nr:unnamed protein product [Hymenolepis diminuta]
MEESEFVVVDDEHGTFNGLKEAVQAYGNAKDALCKGITLLNNTLNLTMELALKNAPPDFDSNSEELRNRVLGSLEISPEAVLRDHVKSLCSKLVAMQAQYGELVKQYEDLRMEKSVEQPPQVIRLAGILDEIEACLPNSGFESSTTASTAIKDLDGLCTRAESIRDRIKVAITKPVSTDASVSNSASCYSKDFGENSGEPSTPKVDSEMNRTSSEASLHNCQQHYPLQYPQQHASSLFQYSSQHFPVEFDRPQRLISSSARHSLVLDDDIHLPIGHVERLKKKLSASLIFGSSLDHIPGHLRAIPRRIPGAKELFRPQEELSTPPTPPPRRIPRRPPTQPSVKISTTKGEDIVSLQRNVASLAAAAALQRNISIQAKELIVDGCGEMKEQIGATPSPKLPPRKSISVQTQTEVPSSPLTPPSWWMSTDSSSTPPWQRQNSFSATSSGIGVDDGGSSNSQDNFSSVSKTCFACCKHNAAGRLPDHCGFSNCCSSTCHSLYLLQEVNRMIREEVVSVLKSEMGSMMERQMDYIQQVLKPLKMDSQEPTASSQQDCGSGEYCDAEDSSSPTSSGKVEGFERVERLPEGSEVPSCDYQPMLLPVSRRLLARRFGHQHAPIVCPRLLPSCLMVITDVMLLSMLNMCAVAFTNVADVE